MTIDFWGLGLQAVNVLILVWLLSRIFWRPVAAAIARRQDTADNLIQSAKDTQAKAEVELAEATKAREGIAAERSALLDNARKEAETATKTALAEARAQAEAIIASAKATIAQKERDAQKANARQASELSLVIAARLLARLNDTKVQSAFLSQLITAIKDLPAADRTALLDEPDGIDVVTASDVGPRQTHIATAVQAALGGTPNLRFVIDPDLIAGLELRTQHFVLHNSWRADLTQIRKAVKDAA